MMTKPISHAAASTVVLAAVLLSAACTSRTPLISRLDSSGLTVVSMADPVVLARPVRQLSAAARDYVYLGPVEINRMGDRDHYLWVGLASTIDRELAHATPAAVKALVLLVDGQPMMLPLADWKTALDQPPYETAAPLYATFSARASLDQIQRVASAASIDVHIIPAEGLPTHYRTWQGEWSSWSSLVGAN